MKRPHSPTRVTSWYTDPSASEHRRSNSPPPTSFDEICVRNDFRQTKKDLLEVIVDLDKAEHSMSSLLGQLKNPKNPLQGQLKSQRYHLKTKIKDLKHTYYKLKSRVHLIDKEMKSLSRRNQKDLEDGEISNVKVEEEYDNSGLQQLKKRRV
ncbi:hypothetical protein V8B55DRAFT_1457122 [Mucor lusitanicus]